MVHTFLIICNSYCVGLDTTLYWYDTDSLRTGYREPSSIKNTSVAPTAASILLLRYIPALQLLQCLHTDMRGRVYILNTIYIQLSDGCGGTAHICSMYSVHSLIAWSRVTNTQSMISISAVLHGEPSWGVQALSISKPGHLQPTHCIISGSFRGDIYVAHRGVLPAASWSAAWTFIWQN